MNTILGYPDIISLDSIPEYPPIEDASVSGYIKHVQCEGTRFHVISYHSNGIQCSEENCIVNCKKKIIKLL